jgi:hypothetical protein
MSMVQPMRRSPGSHGLGLRQPTGWRLAIYASIVLWVAMAVGNVALYAVRPTGHWPLLEGVETLQMASLVPIALLLDRVNGGSPASHLVTAIGIAAMLVAIAIDVGFLTGLVAFGVGPVGGPLFVVDYLVVLAWLLAANALAWRAETLRRALALLGMATAITATLLYPLWAIWLAHAIRDPVTMAQSAE